MPIEDYPAVVLDIEQKSKNTVNGKIEILVDDYNLNINDNEKTASKDFLNIRNCISHNLGFIHKFYFPDVDRLTNNARIYWPSRVLYCNTPGSENKKKLKIGENLKDRTTITVSPFERTSKKLPYNTQLTFGENEIHSMVLSIGILVDSITTKVKLILDSTAGRGL